MNENFTGSQSAEDPRRADRPCPFAGSFEQPGARSVSSPRWMQAHLTECLWCLNDFTRLQSLRAGRSPVANGRVQIVQELGAFMLEHKALWLLPIAVILTLFGGLIVLTQGVVTASFVFTAW